MSECCSANQECSAPAPKRFACPVNGKLYPQAPFSTVLHHLKAPWCFKFKQQHYFFCDDPECDVVYFGQDNSTFVTSMLRTKVGVKDLSDAAIICYCFGATRADAKSNQQVKAFVVEQTKKGACACAVFNPSGRCCLKDFPK
ncbi:MAG: hypothetical protein L0Z73_00440 [Gammaproteobacteria bacterium]|nr:hypothetical protein [Gammaproteobacteria bacterium]